MQSEQNIHALIAGHAERQASAVKLAAGKRAAVPWQVEAYKRFHAAAGAFLAKWTGGKVRPCELRMERQGVHRRRGVDGAAVGEAKNAVGG